MLTFISDSLLSVIHLAVGSGIFLVAFLVCVWIVLCIGGRCERD